MGAQLVRLAYARWSHLPDRAFRVLAFMALVAMDADTPPIYFGGRETLSRLGLGRMTPDEPARSDRSARAEAYRKQRRADFEAVKSAIRELVDAGPVRVVSGAAPGRTAVYSLHLDAATGQSIVGDIPGDSSELMGQGEPVERGRVTLSTGQGDPVEWGRVTLPPTTKEEQRETTLGAKSAEVPTSLAALPNYNDAAKYLSQLPDLGMRYLEEITGEYTLPERVILAAAAARKDREAS